MQDQFHIKTVADRNAKAVELRPMLGQGTAVTRVKLREGMSCEVEEGTWSFVVGMSKKSGRASAYSRFDDQTREAAHTEYLASIAGYRNGNGYEIPGEFVVGWGRAL